MTRPSLPVTAALLTEIATVVEGLFGQEAVIDFGHDALGSDEVRVLSPSRLVIHASFTRRGDWSRVR